MWFNYSKVLLFLLFVIRKNEGELISDENEAWEFLRCRDETVISRCENKEDWLFFDIGKRTGDFAWQNFTDPLLKRAFWITAKNEEDFLQLKTLLTSERSDETYRKSKEISNIYSNSGACLYGEEEEREAGENCTILTAQEISEKLRKVGDAEERKYYWIAWRDSVGRTRSLFEEVLNHYKEPEAGFPEYTDTWLRPYDETSPSILQDVDDAYQEILPLYKELHAFVRRRLINKYGSEDIDVNGPIPSHLLDLKSDMWLSAKDDILPYPSLEVDIVEIMKEKNTKTIDILKLADDFYDSIGLSKIDDDVWNNTKIPTDENCRAILQFQNNCRRKLSGITACLPLEEHVFHVAIGEIVNIYTLHPYMEQRTDWPWMIYFDPNLAFTPGLARTVELSTWTNKYLALKEFEQVIPNIADQLMDYDINSLMKVALRHLPLLFSLYKEMQWRWDTYRSVISASNFNAKWWEYSLEYQGISSPVRRTEDNFDPASATRTILRLPMLSQFIGIVYGFQFHKAICEEVEHRDFLHRCNLYGKRAFGDKIRNATYLGNSIPPTESLSIMTNGASVKMDTKPLLDYFQPLYEWLRNQNENETIGWDSESENQMLCP